MLTAEWAEAALLRHEPTLPSEPVRMATTRMEYDDSRARAELGYSSIPCPRGPRPRGAVVPRARIRQARPRRTHSSAPPGLAPERDRSDDTDDSYARERLADDGTATRARRLLLTRPGGPGTPTTADDRFDVGALLAARGTKRSRCTSATSTPRCRACSARSASTASWARAEGPYLFDSAGNAYLDFLAGFGVFALGRCHPVIEQALRDAMDAALPNLVQMDCPPLAGLLAEALVARMPDDAYRCFFTNSGAESIETVLKFYAGATGRCGESSSPTTRSTD